jgi:hypothetical protein
MYVQLFTLMMKFLGICLTVLLCSCNFIEKTKMQKLSSQTSSTSSLIGVEPLRQPVSRHKVSPPPVIPTDETLRFHCRYYPYEIDVADDFDSTIWNNACEVSFNLRAKDGIPEGPATFIRFLWTETCLNFYVEVEQSHPSYVLNDSKVWLGDNIEFLIAPRWFSEPFYDEYEFLFNSRGSYMDLHWIKDRTIEDAIKWAADGIKLNVFTHVTFHRELSGWAFQGKIPFSSFRMGVPQANEYWGLGLFRKHYVDPSTELLLAWSPPLVNPPKFHTPSRFGMLVFIAD